MKFEEEEIEAIANAVASRIAERVGSSSGERLQSNVGRAAGSADASVQTGNDIIAALNRGDRKYAVELWLTWRSGVSMPATKTALCKEERVDRGEYYRWERGELPDGSQADQAIRRALLKLFA